MITKTHEVILKFIERDPRMVLNLARDLGIELPENVEAHQTKNAFSKLTNLLCDASFKITPPGSQDALCGFIVEFQRDIADDKLWSWPVYATGLRQVLRSKVHLLVVTPREDVARWCSKAIDLGCGEIRPTVIGPAQIPVITDPDRATEALGLAVLSGLAHGHGSQAKDVGTALGEALGRSTDVSSAVCLDVLATALSTVAWKALTMRLENYEPESEWGKNLVATGEVTGAARALLTVLEARGLAVDEATQRRVQLCSDREQLQDWIRRAATVSTIDDVFDNQD